MAAVSIRTFQGWLSSQESINRSDRTFSSLMSPLNVNESWLLLLPFDEQVLIYKAK